jgi:hypothetical protein
LAPFGIINPFYAADTMISFDSDRDMWVFILKVLWITPVSLMPVFVFSHYKREFGKGKCDASESPAQRCAGADSDGR